MATVNGCRGMRCVGMTGEGFRYETVYGLRFTVYGKPLEQSLVFFP